MILNHHLPNEIATFGGYTPSLEGAKIIKSHRQRGEDKFHNHPTCWLHPHMLRYNCRFLSIRYSMRNWRNSSCFSAGPHRPTAQVRVGDEFRESLSHAELWALAGRLAHQLGDAKSVAILLERGVAMAGSPKMCAEPTAKYGIMIL